jgi:hypothetical protein
MGRDGAASALEIPAIGQYLRSGGHGQIGEPVLRVLRDYNSPVE